MGPLSKDPGFIALRNAAKAQPTLAGKLGVVDAAAGFYGQGDDMTRRRAVARIALEDALDDVDNPDVVNVLCAALDGVPDKSMYGWRDLKGATIQGTLGTSVSLFDALDVLVQRDKAAADIVFRGAHEAGRKHVAIYQAETWQKFRNRFGDALSNPFGLGAYLYPAVGGVAGSVVGPLVGIGKIRGAALGVALGWLLGPS